MKASVLTFLGLYGIVLCLCRPESGSGPQNLARNVFKGLSPYLLSLNISPIPAENDPPSKTDKLDRALLSKDFTALAEIISSHPKSDLRLLEPFLSHENPLLRKRAIYALGYLKLQQGIPRLLKLLKDPDSKIRQEAIFALAQYKKKETLPHFLKALTDPDYHVQVSAITTLANFKDPSVKKALIQIVSDKNSRLRLPAARSLAPFANQLKVGDLLPLVSDQHYLIRREAVTLLGEMKNRQATPILKQALLDKDNQVVKAAVQALGKIGEASCETLLIKMYSTAPELKGDIVAAIAKIASPQGIAFLLELLKEKNPKIKAYAINAISGIYYYKIRWYINEAIYHKSPAVRKEAVYIMEQSKDPRYLETLTHLLSDPEKKVRGKAFLAIREIGGPQMIPVMIKLLSHKDNSLRRKAIQIIAEQKDKRALPALLDALGQKRESARRAIIQAIAGFEDRQALPFLKPLLKNRSLKPAVVKAIEQIEVRPNFLRTHLKKTGPREFEIHRRLVTELLNDPIFINRLTRLFPTRKRLKQGVQIQIKKKHLLFQLLSLKNKDILLTIDKDCLTATNFQAVFSAHFLTRTAVAVEIQRGENLIKFHFTIQE